MRTRGQARGQRVGRWHATVVAATLVFGGATVAAASTDSIVVPATVTDRAVRVDPPGRTFTIAATGDVLTEHAVLVTAAAAAGPGERYDFGAVFAPVAPIISAADLAICHMELPIGSPGERAGIYGRSPFGGNLLLAPAEVAGGLRDAGFDRCSTASNHSNDLGVGGLDSTLDRFDEVGISHVGTARTPAEAAPTVFGVEGVRVAHLAVTRYSNTVEPSEPWRLDFPTSAGEVIGDVRAVRAAGAEVVILSVHVSKELLRAPTDVDRSFVDAITATGLVDLVVVHGPHVVQPVEQVNDTWVYWSVGNFVSAMGQPVATRYGPPTLDGLLAWVRFTETAPGRFEVAPTSVLLCSEIVSRIVRPAVAASADPALPPAIRSQMQQCIDRSASLVPDLT